MAGDSSEVVMIIPISVVYKVTNCCASLTRKLVATVEFGQCVTTGAFTYVPKGRYQ